MATGKVKQLRLALAKAKTNFVNSKKPVGTYVPCADTRKKQKRDRAYWAKLELEHQQYQQKREAEHEAWRKGWADWRAARGL